MADPEGRTESLQTLLDRLVAGDEAAADDLITHSMERLRRLTRKMLRDNPAVRRWEQTDDVLQNSLLRLHRALKEARPQSPSALLGLAARQIRWELTDLARHHYGPEGDAAHHISDAAKEDSQGRPVSLHDRMDPQPSPLTQLRMKELHTQVQMLPEEEREVFERIIYLGMSQHDIAKELDISVPTVKRRWRSARLLLSEATKETRPVE